MANFPTSVFAPASKNTGDTIQATHVNALQDEVTAIEDGYLNGTARLNSSHSTVVALSVTGGSTFAGAATFSGAVTFAQSVTLPRQPVCKVTHDAVQQIGNGAWTGLSWNTETEDSTGMHSTAVNSSRITLTSSGVWQVCAQIEWLGNATPSHAVRVFVNDTDAIAAESDAAQNIDPFCQTAIGLYVTASTSDYVTVQVYNNGSTGRVNAASSGTAQFGGPRFWAVRLSQ